MESKGTIIFDIDGVILDFYKPFIEFYNKKYNKEYKVSDLDLYDIAEGLHIDPQIIVDFHDEEICGDLPLIDPTVPAFIKQRRSEGYLIVLNTDFPTQHSGKRIDNLAKYGIEFDAIHFRNKRNVTEFYSNIKCVFEDGPRWIELYHEQGLQLHVPHRDYLRKEPFLLKTEIRRYTSFDEIVL